jgi:hypothetical protein
MPAKRERTITRLNPAAQTCPVLDSCSFVPILIPPCRTCLVSTFIVLNAHISFHVIAVFVLRKPLFINWTLPYLCWLHEYHIIYSARYYPRFHETAGLGMYYPRIQGHTYIYIYIYIYITGHTYVSMQYMQDAVCLVYTQLPAIQITSQRRACPWPRCKKTLLKKAPPPRPSIVIKFWCTWIQNTQKQKQQ